MSNLLAAILNQALFKIFKQTAILGSLQLQSDLYRQDLQIQQLFRNDIDVYLHHVK